VLISLKDLKFYIGRTNNLSRRMAEHDVGKNISTAKRRPLCLIFYESFLDKKDSVRRERYFKSSKGKTTLRQMIREFLKSYKCPT
jgi:putative endonuclease